MLECGRPRALAPSVCAAVFNRPSPSAERGAHCQTSDSASPAAAERVAHYQTSDSASPAAAERVAHYQTCGRATRQQRRRLTVSSTCATQDREHRTQRYKKERTERGTGARREREEAGQQALMCWRGLAHRSTPIPMAIEMPMKPKSQRPLPITSAHSCSVKLCRGGSGGSFEGSNASVSFQPPLA